MEFRIGSYPELAHGYDPRTGSVDDCTGSWRVDGLPHGPAFVYCTVCDRTYAPERFLPYEAQERMALAVLSARSENEAGIYLRRFSRDATRRPGC